MSGVMYQAALAYAMPELVPVKETLQSTLSEKVLALNIFYDELTYTQASRRVRKCL
jgi:hypothetical protein